MLLAVAASSGSSPGRPGYKMAVGEGGDLSGSIGGGVMEVELVERARQLLSEKPAAAADLTPSLVEQEHRENARHPSGMICSGEQTVIFKLLSRTDIAAVETAGRGSPGVLVITDRDFVVKPPEGAGINIDFRRRSNVEFEYREGLGPRNRLIIIGGGHCSLALSELMSTMDFRISIFDDRPELNTLEKNEFADEITVLSDYDRIGDHVRDGGDETYVVVMTLGYKTDAVVIRQLVARDFKYFGVLGSKAKMATLIRELKAEGVDPERLSRMRAPVGIPINSRTPDEIAVSIAAEIISVKNS